jgi:dihydroorotate dehydrogenase (NAD+) catalytic subunit
VKAISIPVIGCGGIRTAEDVLEFLCVGCKAVQVGTASFQDPYALPRLVRALAPLLSAAGHPSVEAFVGTYRG